MSYIIKNCPASQQGTCEKYGMCQDYTDCLLKQIAEKAKYMKNEWGEDLLNFPDKYKFFKSGRSEAGKEVLSLLDIEKCEE